MHAIDLLSFDHGRRAGHANSVSLLASVAEPGCPRGVHTATHSFSPDGSLPRVDLASGTMPRTAKGALVPLRGCYIRSHFISLNNGQAEEELGW